VSDLSSSVRDLARYLYSSEITMQRRKINSYTDAAMNNSASHLITLSENLRFLKFDVSREQYNPDSIFQQAQADNRKPDSAADDNKASFLVHWEQHGDFWRDERTSYKAVVRSRCGDAEDNATPKAPEAPKEETEE
jgi:hypothetical protein